MRAVGVAFALNGFIQAFLRDVLDLEDTVALLGCLTLEECVNSVSTLVMRRLEMLLLDLKASLTEHSGTFDVSVCDGQVQRVQTLVCLHVQLEVHSAFDQGEKHGCKNMNVASLRSQVNRTYVCSPDLLRV